MKADPRLPLLVLASSVLLALAITASTARGAITQEAHCGMRITEDTTLTRDLRGCKDDGIVFAADGVTLNLNGHTIEGDGTVRKDCPKGAICDDGVVSIGHSRLTVEGGTITNFAIGAIVFQGHANQILGVTSTANQFSGMNISSSGSLIAKSTFSKNGTLDFGPGIYLYHARGTLVTESRLIDNGAIGVDMSALPGERVIHNVISGNPADGVVVEGSGATVARNALSGNGWGIAITGNRNRIADNEIGRPGCADGCQFGIALEGGHDNLIARNRVAEADTADLLITSEEKGPPTQGNLIRGNLLIDGGRYGVDVEASAAGTSLVDNVSRGAGLFGFLIKGASTYLHGNRAPMSGRLPIRFR